MLTIIKNGVDLKNLFAEGEAGDEAAKASSYENTYNLKPKTPDLSRLSSGRSRHGPRARARCVYSDRQRRALQVQTETGYAVCHVEDAKLLDDEAFAEESGSSAVPATRSAAAHPSAQQQPA